jgi:hypothetical protein
MVRDAEIMKDTPIFQIRIMLRLSLAGMKRLIVPGLVLTGISLIVFKPGPVQEFALRISLALPFVGFLWGLRVYEYSSRFSRWKDYLDGKTTLAEAFKDIADRRVWVYIIPAAYFCGIAIGVVYYLVIVLRKAFGGFYASQFSFGTFFLWIPACTMLLLLGANIFGPKPNEEEGLALDVVKILKQSPGISPMEIESPAAIERFIDGAMTARGENVKPYLWILGLIRPPQAMTVFKSALESGDPRLRQIAATYIGRVGSVEASQAMDEQQSDETGQ